MYNLRIGQIVKERQKTNTQESKTSNTVIQGTKTKTPISQEHKPNHRYLMEQTVRGDG